MRNRWRGLLAGTALLFTPVATQAQNCYDLRAQRDENITEMLGIAADYPKTHVGLMACVSDARSPREEKEACAASILAAACIGLGITACGDLMGRWRNASLTQQRIKRAMQREGCVQ